MSVLIIGHRGASGYMPENTLPAFERALEDNADGIELDIWPDATGVPMVIHDESLSRTFNHSGKVTTMHEAALMELGVASYQQVLDLAPGKLVIFTELKGGHENRVGQAIYDAVTSGKWHYDQLPVIGFDHTQLARLKTEYPRLHIAPSFSKRMLKSIPISEQADYMIATADEMQAAAINPDYRLVTKELVNQAHAADLKVNIWTVNNPKTMRKMIEMGVDAIMTDYPDRLYQIVYDAEKGA